MYESITSTIDYIILLGAEHFILSKNLNWTKIFLIELLMMWPTLSTKKLDTNNTQIYHSNKYACDMLISFDDTLWFEGRKNMSKLVNIAKHYVDELNEKFVSQIFTDEFQQLYFNLARVQVSMGLCEGVDSNCEENPEGFLKQFERMINPKQNSEFCIAILLTDRNFHKNISGYSFMGQACNDQNNSGFVSFVGKTQFEATSFVLAHEVAHLFGAKHDQDHGKEDCIDNQFIMNNVSIPPKGDATFSVCSKHDIKKRLNELLERKNCFQYQRKPLEISLCGNGIIEPGEECDCGTETYECGNPCCYPANIPLEEKVNFNRSAIACSSNESKLCLNHPATVFGLYIPLMVISIMVLIIICILRLDWGRDKMLFQHVTKGNIRIVSAR